MASKGPETRKMFSFDNVIITKHKHCLTDESIDIGPETKIAYKSRRCMSHILLIEVTYLHDFCFASVR